MTRDDFTTAIEQAAFDIARTALDEGWFSFDSAAIAAHITEGRIQPARVDQRNADPEPGLLIAGGDAQIASLIQSEIMLRLDLAPNLPHGRWQRLLSAFAAGLTATQHDS